MRPKLAKLKMYFAGDTMFPYGKPVIGAVLIFYRTANCNIIISIVPVLWNTVHKAFNTLCQKRKCKSLRSRIICQHSQRHSSASSTRKSVEKQRYTVCSNFTTLEAALMNVTIPASFAMFVAAMPRIPHSHIYNLTFH